MLARKDYIKLAEALRFERGWIDHEPMADGFDAAVDALKKFLKEDNPNFRKDMFEDAYEG